MSLDKLSINCLVDKKLHIQQPTYLYNDVSLILCLQNHVFHQLCSSHMSEHLWIKGFFLSLLPDSGTPFHQTPKTHTLSTFRSVLETHHFKLSIPLELSPIHWTAYPDLMLVFSSLLTYGMISGIRKQDPRSSLLLILLLQPHYNTLLYSAHLLITPYRQDFQGL